MYKDTLCWIRTSVRCTGVKGKTLISTLIHGTRVVDPGGVDPDPTLEKKKKINSSPGSARHEKLDQDPDLV